jgi:uncharacterized protein
MGAPQWEPPTPEEAVKYFRERAMGGDVGGMVNLAGYYTGGVGVKADFAEAAHWYTRAALLGNARAMTEIGTMQLGGLGIKKDVKQAVAWLQKAAEHGDPREAHASHA